MKGKALELNEYLTLVLKVSKFKEIGVITPEKFVAAGDYLVYHYPIWWWAKGKKESAGTPTNSKQFWLTKTVPGYTWCKQVQYSHELWALTEENDGDRGWVDT